LGSGGTGWTGWPRATGDADAVLELLAQADVEMRLARADVVLEAGLVDDLRLFGRRSTRGDANRHETEESDQRKYVSFHQFSFLFRQIALIWLPGITV
jgi:hypothetical protein